MRFTSIAIHNYKGFDQHDAVELAPGFNILVGRNSAGKTAFLEALSLAFGGAPHVRSRNTPTTSQVSSAEVGMVVEREEVDELLADKITEFCIPDPDDGTATDDRVSSLLGTRLSVAFRRSARHGGGSEFSTIGEQSAIRAAGPYVAKRAPCYRVRNGSFERLPPRARHDALKVDLGVQIANALTDRIYRFYAERFHVGESQMGTVPDLAPDASNLPAVLHLLQTSARARFEEFEGVVRKILPEIAELSVRPHPQGGGKLQVVIWGEGTSSANPELAVPLTECGTGVGQVLALVYVVFTAAASRVLLIDEPSTFLHPGAVRTLLDTLRELGPRHQYILSTHSPLVVNACQPANVIHVERHGTSTQCTRVHTEQVRGVQRLMADVGARLSDVFGCDRVLWVEGATEELCFPSILAGASLPRAMAILAVTDTGPFERKSNAKNRERILRIYKALSGARFLIPPAIGFLFDREGMADRAIADLRRESRGLIRFTERRCYENYLLDSDAIAAVLNAAGIEATASTVIDCFDRHAMKGDRANEILAPSWLAKVDGARLLNATFNDFSGGRLAFVKTDHSVQLTDWLLQNKPEQLAGLRRELLDTIGG